MRCRAAISWQPVNLWRVQRAVDEGRLDPAARITMRELRDSGAAGKRVQHGFKLLAKVSAPAQPSGLLCDRRGPPGRLSVFTLAPVSSAPALQRLLHFCCEGAMLEPSCSRCCAGRRQAVGPAPHGGQPGVRQSTRRGGGGWWLRNHRVLQQAGCAAVLTVMAPEPCSKASKQSLSTSFSRVAFVLPRPSAQP